MIAKHQRAPAEPLSARIFRLRIARGYSVYEFAKAAGVFAGTVHRLESGKPVDKHVMPALAALPPSAARSGDAKRASKPAEIFLLI